MGSFEHNSFIEFSKSLTIKDAVYRSAKSSDEISTLSLSRAWNKLGFGPDGDSQQEELPEFSMECSQLGIFDIEKGAASWVSLI